MKKLIVSCGEPWFCAKDVCEALGISDAKQAVDTLEADERGGYNVPTPGGIQKTTFISEPGLYAYAKSFRAFRASVLQCHCRRTRAGRRRAPYRSM